MRIALDAMGGDFAPKETVQGALDAIAVNPGYHIILVGDETIIRSELQGKKYDENQISILHTDENIEMSEHAATAFRKKKNASIVLCNDLVKKGEADAVVAAGNTGAAMTASLLRMGRLGGVDRPAIATILPTAKQRTILLDSGANTDCSAKQLAQFAIMGDIFARRVHGYEKPRVGLLNIGEEASKGNLVAQKAYELLSEMPLNFIGNIEGRDIPEGTADVVVCDGFVGNIVLKLYEGLGKLIMREIKGAFMKNAITKLGAICVKSGLKAIKNKMDYQEVGGAILLGVQGISIISHGSSKAVAIKNAILKAGFYVEKDLVAAISHEMEQSTEWWKV